MEHEVIVGNFGVGQPVRRTEDPMLVRGQGQYTDDIQLEGQVYAVIVRSPVAHGVLRGVDLDAARAMPGVLLAFEGEELASAGYGSLKCRLPYNNRDGSLMQPPARIALARGTGTAAAVTGVEPAEVGLELVEKAGPLLRRGLVPDVVDGPREAVHRHQVHPAARREQPQRDGEVLAGRQAGEQIRLVRRVGGRVSGRCPRAEPAARSGPVARHDLYLDTGLI